MTQIVWTQGARDDLRGIAEYIARDSPHYASLVVARLLDSVKRLAQFPESGRSVPERAGTTLREVVTPPFPHHATAGFWRCYEALPKSAQALADKQFELLKADPGHPPSTS